MPSADRLRQSVENLLFGAAGIVPGARLLIVAERPEHGYYGSGLAPAVATAARALGLDVSVRDIGFDPEALPEIAPYADAMQAHDRTLFLARLGDQLRFDPALDSVRPIVCYALDLEMLCSPFGTTAHAALLAAKSLIDAAIARASEVRVTCPLGTDVVSNAGAGRVGADTSVTRFPLSVFTPVLAAGFRGQVAQAGFLVGTGARYYTPYAVPLAGVLRVGIDGHRITGFDGAADDVARARAHYQRVAALYDLDPWTVHSWHAGIHPGCRFLDSVAASPERWSGGAFGNPRLLHFHTCGAEPPGEISLNIVDPTLMLDGTALWEAGQLHLARLPGGAALLAEHPSLARLFADPAREIGLNGAGQLSLSPGTA